MFLHTSRLSTFPTLGIVSSYALHLLQSTRMNNGSFVGNLELGSIQLVKYNQWLHKSLCHVLRMCTCNPVYAVLAATVFQFADMVELRLMFCNRDSTRSASLSTNVNLSVTDCDKSCNFTEGLPTLTNCLVLSRDAALWLVELLSFCAKSLTEISRTVTGNFCRSRTISATKIKLLKYKVWQESFRTALRKIEQVLRSTNRWR